MNEQVEDNGMPTEAIDMIEHEGETGEPMEATDGPVSGERPDADEGGEPIATPEQVEGLVKALAEQAENAADVEETEKRMNGVETAKPSRPRDRELPFGDSRFNADSAFLELVDQNHRVAALKEEWEDQKSLAADAKKSYDTAVETLTKTIERFESKRLFAQNQPSLREVEEGAGDGHPKAANGAPCTWEQEHPGEICRVCHPMPSTDDMPEETVDPGLSDQQIDALVETLEADQAAPAEAARKPAKRGRKKSAKHNPEAERAEQVAEGQKVSKKPRAKKSKRR